MAERLVCTLDVEAGDLRRAHGLRCSVTEADLPMHKDLLM